MPVRDFTRTSKGHWRDAPTSIAPIPSTQYLPGMVVRQATSDVDPGRQFAGAAPPAASATLRGLIGVVAEEFATGSGSTFLSYTKGGFDGKGGTTSPAAGALGTFRVPIVWSGIHTLALIDNTSSSAVDITTNVGLTNSRVTAGWMEGITTGIVNSTVGIAILPASGQPFATLGHGAITAASQTITVGGTPATGDSGTIQIQIPFNDNFPGIAQYHTIPWGPLTSTQATSTTTAAAAIAATLALDPFFAVYYTQSPSAAVITVTVASGNLFRVTFAGITQQNATWGSNFQLVTSGTVGNSLSLGTMTAVGGSTLTASGTNSGFTGYPVTSPLFASGAGYKGTCPISIGGLPI